MSSRKDNKGRVLRNGESQRGDGRYRYEYVDAQNKRHSVYSWTLNPTDRVPAGKKPDKSLRELEEEINNLLDKGINPANKTTVKEIVLEFCKEAVKGKRQSTINSYNIAINHMEKQPFWNVPIISVKKRQAKKWIDNLIESGIGYYTAANIKRILCSAFQVAIDDDDDNILLKNPFDFKMPKIDPNHKPKERVAVNENHLKKLLDYCLERKIYNKWYYVIIILLGTGLRISEFLGLTFNDIDFENDIISVNHQVNCYYNIRGTYARAKENDLTVNPPKTESGERFLKMIPEVKESILWLMNNRPQVDEKEVDGHIGFVLINRNGVPYNADTVDARFRQMIDNYNKKYPNDQIPRFTPHSLRHTFCTDMVYKGMNIKNIQYLMGHKRPDMSMVRYAHSNKDSALNEMFELGKSDRKLQG